MHTLGLSWKRKCVGKAEKLSAAEISKSQDLLRYKLAFCMKLHDVGYDRVVNIDETCVCLLPQGNFGWAAQAGAADLAHQVANITCTLACTPTGKEP